MGWAALVLMALALLGAAPAQAATPESCADVFAQDPETSGGIYTIAPGGHVFSVNCVNTDGGPVEYLVLPTGPENNYGSQGEVQTGFHEVRIDPSTLRLFPADGVYDSNPDYFSPLGTANAQVFSSASARVDLNGTPFEIDDTWSVQGEPSISPYTYADFSPDGKVFEVHVDSGGGIASLGNESIQLKYGPSSPDQGYRDTVLADHPTAYFPLDETDGAVVHNAAADTSGTAGASVLLGGAPATRGGASARFPGFNDTPGQLTIPNYPGLHGAGDGAISVEAWIRPTDIGDFSHTGALETVLGNQSASGPGFGIRIRENGSLWFEIGQHASTRARSVTAAHVVENGKWFHYVGTYDGTTARVYVDGTLMEENDGAGPYAPGAHVTSTGPLLLGGHAQIAEPFRGGIDDLAVYDQALSAAAIGRHYDAGLNGSSNPITSADVSVYPTNAPAGSETIPVGDLGTASLVSASPSELVAAPLRSTPLRSTPLRSTPLRSTPLRSTPLRSTPLRSTVLSAVPLRSTPLRSTSWTDLLRGTTLEGVPLNAVTLEQAFALNTQAINNLTLEDIDLDASPLRSTSLGALMLDGVTLGDLGGTDAQVCDTVGGGDASCDAGALKRQTLTELELAGHDLTPYYRLGLPLPAGGLGTTPLAGIALGDVRLAATPFGAVPASTLGGIVPCIVPCNDTLADLQRTSPQSLAGVTVGALLARLPLPSLTSVSLASLLVGIVPADEIPLGLVPLGDLLRRAPLRDDLVTTTVSFTLDCTRADGLRIEVPVPDGVRFGPDSASLAGRGVMDPRRDGDTLVFEQFGNGDALSTLCAATESHTPAVQLSFAVEPPPAIGPLVLQAHVAVDGGAADAHPAAVDVDDGHDAGSTPATARAIEPDIARTGYVTSDADIDTYALDAPAAGSRVTVRLTHLPADYDVSVLGPPTGLDAVRPSPLRSTPLRSTPLLDQGAEPGADPRTHAPQTLQDAPLRSTLLADTPLRSTSMKRNRSDESTTFVVESGDAGQTFYLQVAGHNGATSAAPYLLDVSVTPPTTPPACVGSRSLATVAPAQAGGAPASDTQTLFLVNEQRMVQLYSRGEYATMRATLDTIAANGHGAVIPVDSDPDVRAAYAALEASRCSPDAANHVAEAINALVDRERAGLTGLRHIVLVGGDDVIPQVRVRDLVSVSNEREAADELMFDGHDNAVSRALRDGYVLTDDPYGDFNPQSWLSGQLFVPDVALGRLVETPGEIAGQLDQFVASQGILDPQEARVAGYDFLADGATEVLDQLKPAVGGRAVSEINATWTAATAIDTIRRASAGFTSINAHYDYHRALPASAFNASGAPDLVLAGDATPAPGSVLFTMGCHAGLSLPDTSVLDHARTASDPAAEAALLDWSQQFSRNRSVFVANSGYGYGDTTSVAWSERIMSLLAGQLAGKQVTAGQALMFAKQRFIADSGVPGVYDAKASQEATFYGLPMYRIGASGGQGAAVLPPTPAGGTTVRSDPFALDPALERKDSATRGTHWEVENQVPQVSHFRPIQPRTSLDVTATDRLPAHGALIEDLRSSDLGNIDPEYARPTIDLSENEPEVAARSDVFPASIQRVTSLGTPDGIRDLLVLVTGQFITDPSSPTGRGTQRLFSHIGGQVLRSSSSDFEPPALRNISGEVIGSGVTFSVETPDDDATRGVVLYRDDRAGSSFTWRRADLVAAGPGVFQATGGVGPGATEVVEYTVQLADAAGNVSVASNKGPGYSAQPAPPPSNTGATIAVSPAEPASGYFRSAPTISLDAGGGDLSGYEVRIGTGDFQPYTAPFQLLGDGTRLITVRAPDGTIARRTVSVDGTAPLLDATPDPDWSGGDTTAELSATDPVGGSGVAGLTYHATGAQDIAETTVADDRASVPITATGVTDVTYTATDHAGNVSGPRTVRVRIDRGDPTAAADVTPAPHAGWNRDSATVHLTGTDTGSGIDALLVRATGAQPFAERTLPGAAGDVTITVAGTTTLTFRARDRVGRLSPAQDIAVRIDRAAPAAGHTFSPATPASGWFTGPADVALTGTDATGGSGVGALHWRATGAQPISPTDAAGDHATVHVTRDGTTQLTATATDVAGNESPTDSATVKIDAAAPTAASQVLPAPVGGWNRTAPTVRLTGADDAGATDRSGVESITYRLTGASGDRTATVPGAQAEIPITAQGVSTVVYTARDRAGNVSREGRIDARYDAIAPVGTSSLSTPANAAGWHKAPVTVTLGGNDASSGIARVNYLVTGGTPQVVNGSSASTTISREGITTVTYTVTDGAGNTSVPKTVTVRLDRGAPVITCTPDPAYLWPINLELVPVKVAVAAHDGGSGLTGVTLTSVTSNSWLLLNVFGFRVGTADTSGWLRAIPTLVAGQARTYTLTYESADVAGNTARCAALVTVAKPPRK